MYLHIGLDKIIDDVGILGIFDLDTSTVSKATRDYLAKAEKEGRVVAVCMDLPKSFIVYLDESGNEIVYISQLATSTLLKRIQTSTII